MQASRLEISNTNIKSKIENHQNEPIKKGKAQSPVKRLKQEEIERQKKIKEPALTKLMNRTIKLEIDPETNTVVAKIIDRDTGEVIRQIPPEELLKIAKNLERAGVLLNREA